MTTKCPRCGGYADNGHDRECPPNVYLCSKCSYNDMVDDDLMQTYGWKKTMTERGDAVNKHLLLQRNVAFTYLLFGGNQ
jgi:hypothetical protein